jgi:hypothetical protein
MPEIITATSRLGLLQKEQAISGIGSIELNASSKKLLSAKRVQRYATQQGNDDAKRARVASGSGNLSAQD